MWADLDSELGELFGDLQGVSFVEQTCLVALRRDERQALSRKPCRFPGCTEPKVAGRAECYCETHRAQKRAARKKMGDRAGQQRRKRARRKAAGLCQACGQHPAEKPTTLCTRCRVIANRAGKRAYRRRKETA